jgi:DNA-directed RNA polymerase specialized sigma subunit
MTIKEYLSQAYRIDQRINSKLEQVSSLRELAVKATSTLSDTYSSGNGNKQKMEGVIVKIIDLEHEIDEEIDRLVDLKQEIVSLIKKVKNPEYQTLLELRYLNFKTWEQIATEMHYSIQHTFRIHDKALSLLRIFKR